MPNRPTPKPLEQALSATSQNRTAMIRGYRRSGKHQPALTVQFSQPNWRFF
jgi:hypothetical protein